MNSIKKQLFYSTLCLILLFANTISKTYIPTNIDEKEFPELAKFAKKYRCSKEVEANKEQHFLKGREYDRIINAQRMKNIIERNKLDHLQVADKCLCDQDGLLTVLSQRAPVGYGKNTLSPTEVEQLSHLAEKTGFRDWRGNVKRNKDGKLVFFDTENFSFGIGKYRGVEGMDLPAHCKFNFVASLMAFEGNMEPDARELFYAKINSLLNTEAGKAKAIILPNNSEYDNSDIDFVKVKEELKRYEASQPQE